MHAEERIVTLIDEEGEIFEFMIIDCFTVEGKEYAVAVPLQEDDDTEGEGEDYDDYLPTGESPEEDMEEQEAVIFQLCRDGQGATSFQIIEDEAEWQRISAIALERLYKEEE